MPVLAVSPAPGKWDWEHGITVYGPRCDGGPWRAVFTENGRRRWRQATTWESLAAKLEKVTVRLAADADFMERPGADLIAHYLSDSRLPVHKRWSRKHKDTQRSLCARFAAPVIGGVICQDITTEHMQQIVNAAPTAGEGARLRRCLKAMAAVGLDDGYLANPKLMTLNKVHWEPADRPVPEPRTQAAGESSQFVDPAEIPADGDVAALAAALAEGQRGDLDELMAYTAAYSGLRLGELLALGAGQIAAAAREITVDRKVVEVRGRQFVEAPKFRKSRKTVYPVRTPQGYPLAEKLAIREAQARAEMKAGTNPMGLMFPSPKGKLWWSSNFGRRILAPAYRAAGWRDEAGNGRWTWHSLRHVFCVTALFTWKTDSSDVSLMAGHAQPRTTWEMYVGITAGALNRAREATAT
jgi:integrase